MSKSITRNPTRQPVDGFRRDKNGFPISVQIDAFPPPPPSRRERVAIEAGQLHLFFSASLDGGPVAPGAAGHAAPEGSPAAAGPTCPAGSPAAAGSSSRTGSAGGAGPTGSNVEPARLEEPAAARVSVLYVSRNSYYHVLNADCYDAKRDAQSFSGSNPVVAHPPCRTWSAFCSHQAKAPEGEKALGVNAVETLRRVGGILEHPAHSRLFDYCDLPKPGEPGQNGIWSVEVSQAWWGFPCTKRTWLCFFYIPESAVAFPKKTTLDPGCHRRWQGMSKNQRAATPPRLAEWLIETAKHANPPKKDAQ